MITNTADVSLALAVWLVHDDYDYINTPNYVSATSLMKPLRQIILSPQVDNSATPPDVTDFIARAMGSSLHASIEKVWTQHYTRSLKLLGYPEAVIKRIVINPEDSFIDQNPNAIPIYIEQRAHREFKEFVIGGKFDMVTEGLLQDTKSTSVFVWMNGERRFAEHQLQGSIYRWIDSVQPRPKITEDYIRINYIFTDWQKALARYKPEYPQHRVAYKEIPLLSLQETEDWIASRLALIQKYKNQPEEKLPECTDEELWRGDTRYKYYSNPEKIDGRSTRNFDSMADARAYQTEKGGRGTIVIEPGEPKRCSYCPVFNICSQKDRYFTT
jgi:hypothetical protein